MPGGKYIPKSKIVVKQSKGNLAYVSNKAPYNGPYIETSDGRLFAGTDNVNFGEALFIPEGSVGTVSVDYSTFDYNTDANKFNIINPGLKKFMEKIQKIPSNKPKPAFKDYTRGYFRRYFAQRINSSKYIEINKKTYDSIQKREGKYDHYLYKVGHLAWFISGRNVHKYNSLSLLRSNTAFPYIMALFPILNEYWMSGDDPKAIENQYTNGNELYYANGTTYVGPYHTHPEKGPMVGAVHSNEPHDKLYYFKTSLNQFPTSNDYETFLQEYNKINCYSCENINGTNQIITTQISSLVGCPENSFLNSIEAEESCFKESDTPSMDENQPTAQAPPTNQGNNAPSSGGSVSYSSGGGVSSGGGGTSGGGGGGY